MNKEILIVAIGYLPNIGGLETHLKDLTDELVKKKWKVVVLTYQPINTPVLGKWIEKSKDLTVYRLPTIRGLFYKLLKFPALEFLFLGPLFFITIPFILIKYPDIDVINAQGVIAGLAACFWKILLNKKLVVSAQSVYNFPKEGLYRSVCKWIFECADRVVAISNQTKEDIASLGIRKEKIIVYTNWEDTDKFKVVNKKLAKKKIGFGEKFIVSFFGRLVEEKGVLPFLDAIKKSNPKIDFLIYGEGPLKDVVVKSTKENKNLRYMSTISPEELNLHYSAADILVVPSTHEEGFGRVAAGALLSGTPVIASNKGALPEVVNNFVGKIISPTPSGIAKEVNFLYSHPASLKSITAKTRDYAVRKFSSKNAEIILQAYSFQ